MPKAILISLFASSWLFATTFHCSGTEPFWGFSLSENKPRLDLFGETETVSLVSVENFHGQSDGAGISVRLKGKNPIVLQVVRASGCSDGMSERIYDSYATLDREGKTFFGCCAFDLDRGKLFHVVGLPAGETLNVRKGPSGNFEVIDKLSYNAQNLEQQHCDGPWCFVRYKKGEQKTAGWVHSRYLQKTQP